MISAWPKSSIPSNVLLSGYTTIERVKLIITSIRNIRTENKIESNKKISLVINSKNKIVLNALKSQDAIVKALKTGVDNIQYSETETGTENFVKRVLGDVSLFFDLSEAIDTAKEKIRIEKEIENIAKFVNGLAERLQNEDFVAKAPEQVIAQQKESLTKKQAELAELKKQLGTLS